MVTDRDIEKRQGIGTEEKTGGGQTGKERDQSSEAKKKSTGRTERERVPITDTMEEEGGGNG